MVGGSRYHGERRKAHGFFVCAFLVGALLLILGTLSLPPSARATDIPPAPACTTAEALETLGRLDAAESAYLEELKTELGVKCATTGLESLGRRETKCTKAEALAGAGQKAKAEEAFEKALEADPATTCAETGLKKLSEKSGTAKIESFGTTMTSVLKAFGVLAGALLVAMLAVVILCLLGLQVLTRWRRTKDHRPATWAVRPSVEIKELDAKWMEKDYGPQFAGQVRAGITPAGGANVDMVTGHTGLSERLKPIEEISQAKAATAVVSFLLATLPRRQYEVSGALEPAGEDGIGASVVLTNDSRSVDAETFWGKTFGLSNDDAKAIEGLAVPVAGWVVHRTALALGTGEKLITTNSMSFALFKSGSYWQGKGDSDKAADLYRAALEIDPRNSGALANLGLVEWRAHEWEEAIGLFERALARAENGLKKNAVRLDRDWYRIKFNLAGARVDWSKADADQSEQLSKAHTEVTELCRRALKVIVKKPKGTDEALVRLLEEILPAAIALWAATLSERSQ